MSSGGKRLWHAIERVVVFVHVGGAAVSGLGWLGSTLGGLDRSYRVGLGIGFVYCLAMLAITLAYSRWVSWRSMHSIPLRRWLELRRYTNAGLTWMLVERGEVEGRAVATLRISPTSELPVPLQLEVTCACYLQEGVGVKLYPPEADKYADVHIYPIEGNKAYVTLMGPRLHPPVYLEVSLRSAGNATINVLNVKRNPK